jgi:hypothetical protein
MYENKTASKLPMKAVNKAIHKINHLRFFVHNQTNGKSVLGGVTKKSSGNGLSSFSKYLNMEEPS